MTITIASSSLATLFFALIFLPSIVRTQERSPHGVAYESPLAISPEAYAFFHPKIQHQNSNNNTANTTSLSSCDRSESDCSPFPTASSVQSDLAHESTAARDGGKHRIGAGATAGILIGLAFAVLLALGVFFMVIARKRNLSKANAAIAQPEV